MKKFALIGTAGFVSPRHLQAIKETGGELVAAFDPHDAVGILDRFFPDAASFTEFERLDRHLEKLRRAGEGVDFLTVCSPNYLHDSHVRFGLRSGMDVICEKPLVLTAKNLEPLQIFESETSRRVWTILQLRLHPALLEWKKKLENELQKDLFQVDLTYIAPRGAWYFGSWKGDDAKSGGILANIGVHLFDLLGWFFGDCEKAEIHQKTHARAAGFLKMERAEVRWFLSIERAALPDPSSMRAFRKMTVDGESVEFEDGFADLHTASYEAILAGQGNSIESAGRSVRLVDQLRKMPVLSQTPPKTHPFCSKTPQAHPFFES